MAGNYNIESIQEIKRQINALINTRIRNIIASIDNVESTINMYSSRDIYISELDVLKNVFNAIKSKLENFEDTSKIKAMRTYKKKHEHICHRT